MSEAYESLLAELRGEDKENVKRSQIVWIKARDERCVPAEELLGRPYHEVLFTNLYTDRIEELQDWKKYMAGEKTSKFPPWQTKCWKRQEPFNERFSTVTGDECVCRAFEQELNASCETPKELGSNWTIPSNEKRFHKLIWQPLDWKEHWGLIEDLRKAAVREDLREEVWRKYESNLRKEFEEGGWRLSVATVDIDHDNHPELLVRQDRVPPPGTVFGVMIPETKRIDWRYEAKLSKINSSNEGAEIMLYEDKIHKFAWKPGRDFLFIWDENNIEICRFQYLKGGK
jgi:hypothetical protein